MELWEALEVLANRELNFITDVRIIEAGGNTSIDWLIEDVEEPTQQEIDDMMELEPLLRIQYDANGFIWVITKGVLSIPEADAQSITTLNHTKIEGPCTDTINNLPLYKYVNGSIVAVAEPIEYEVDPCLWGKYTLKYQKEITIMLGTKTNQEMKTLHDSVPAYKQEMIFTAIQYFWTDMVPLWNVNLSVEVMIRLLMEKLYIENVENRVMTADELLTFNAMLTQIHASNNMLKNNPVEEGSNLDSSHWYNYFIGAMSQQAVVLRQYAFNQRTFICGR